MYLRNLPNQVFQEDLMLPNFFEPWEFNLRPYGGADWWHLMCPEVLELLNKVRAKHGAPINISPHRGALGRHLGASFSDHNIDRWKQVRVADVFPVMDQTPVAAQKFVDVCLEVGVTALGVYPHWKNKHGVQQVGFHLGYRPERTDNPATWGMIRYRPRGIQHMVPLHQAVALVGQHPKEPT